MTDNVVFISLKGLVAIQEKYVSSVTFLTLISQYSDIEPSI